MLSYPSKGRCLVSNIHYEFYLFRFVFTGVFLDSFLDFIDRHILVRIFLKLLAEEVSRDDRLDSDLRELLLNHCTYPFTPMKVFAEVSPEVLLHLAQKSADAMHLHVKMTLQDFTQCTFLGEYAEKCFLSAYGPDWFEIAPAMGTITKPIRLRPARLLYKHSVSNWEQFDPFSFKCEQ